MKHSEKRCMICSKEFEEGTGVSTIGGIKDCFCSETCREHYYLLDEHERLYESEVVCPYCSHVHSDSWEYGDDNNAFKCEECGRKFSMVRNIEVTYSSTPHLDELLEMKEGDDDDGSD